MKKNYIKTKLSEITDRNLPIIALVGRPNVGKSTLFNRLTRSRRAIVDPTPGMTRDRLYAGIHREQGSFRLVDTGGIEARSDKIAQLIRDQAEHAITEAAAIVFLLDGRGGLNSGDLEIAEALRLVNKPVFIFVNKIDEGEDQLFDTAVYELGFPKILFGSAEHGRGIEGLLEALDEAMLDHRQAPKQADEEVPIRLAVIGRPNVGKSSFVNKLLNEERVMVSDMAGTTRDPIDSFLYYQKRPFCLVDTAGIRKRGKIAGSQESLSVMMAQRQVEQADVIAVLIDADDAGAAQDSAIAGIADKAFKPVIVVVNKWDLVENKTTNSSRDFEDRLRRRLKFLETSTFLFISAKTGQRVTRVLDEAVDLYDRGQKRVSTGILNRFVERMKRNHRIPSYKGKPLKIFYMTQVVTSPPTFVVITSQKDPLHFSQERFLINRIREAFNLDGLPIRIKMKTRTHRDS